MTSAPEEQMTSGGRAPQVVRDELLVLDPPALLGGRCRNCDGVSFPLEAYCPHCGALGPERAALPNTGLVYSYGIARIPAPGYEGVVPYAVGLVELDCGIRVASTLIADPLESLTVGAVVEFRLLDVATEDGAVTSYAYELVRA
jgi:uncharacterized OB-fold protein